MSSVVGLPNHSYKLITNTAWVSARLCKLQKGCTRLAAASDKVYQLLAHGRWFSPASSTTKTGRHDIAEILLKVALKHQKSNQNHVTLMNLQYLSLRIYYTNSVVILIKSFSSWGTNSSWSPSKLYVSSITFELYFFLIFYVSMLFFLPFSFEHDVSCLFCKRWHKRCACCTCNCSCTLWFNHESPSFRYVQS